MDNIELEKNVFVSEKIIQTEISTRVYLKTQSQ